MIDREALVERVAQAIYDGPHTHHGVPFNEAATGDFGHATGLYRMRVESARTDARLALPVIADALLSEVETLHGPAKVYALADECGCGDEDHPILETRVGEEACWNTPTGEVFCPECTGEGAEEYVGHPCPTARLCAELREAVQP